jgi:hypothetical protein
MIILLFFYLVFGSKPLHPFLSQVTNIQCDTTDDCLAYYGNDWCHQNTVCVSERCHLIPFYRCKQGELCMAEEKQCVVKQCSTHGDCDDGVFCNGVERCVNSQCVKDDRFDCSHGICSEVDHSCHTPLVLTKHALRVKESQQQQPLQAKTITIQDTTNSTTNSSVDDWVWVIVGLSVGFFAIVLVILLVSRASRPSSPIIVFDRQTAYGNEVFQQNVRYAQ